MSARTAAAGSSDVDVDGVRRAARERELEHRGIAVDGDDAPAPARTRPAMTCWPTPPQPITAALSPIRGRATLRTAPMPVTAPQPSSAACQSGTLGGQRDDAAGGHDGALGEARDGEAMLQGGAVGQRQARGAVHERAAEAGIARRPAERRPPRPACAAGAARGDHAEHDAVARRDVDDALADLLDGAGALVPEHHRPAPGAEAAGGEMDVGVADAGRRDAHQHLAGFRRRERHLLDADVAGLAQHDGPHAIRQRSRASRSGVTPRPGPGGGAIVPSAAISQTAGSSQSRRSADHAGGS